MSTMKKLLLLSGCFISSIGLLAQSTPLFPYDVPSVFTGTTTVQGPFDIFAPYMGLGPVVIYNTAKVDFIAGERIHLQPGFQAGNFSGDGYFHAQIGATPDFDVVFIEPNESYPQVGQFEKLEMGVKLPATLEQQVDQFFSSDYAAGMNPFNPELISLEATFTKGSESYLVYGFYYREYTRHPDSALAHPDIFEFHRPVWLNQSTDYTWRIRWAPPTTGVWNCAIGIRIGNNPMLSFSVGSVQFNCVPSSNQGWLEQGQSNWNLRFSGTHGSYFALGQNIAWCEHIFRGHYARLYPPGYMLYSGGYLDVLDWTQHLADNGGNMVRVVSRPATYDFEWERLNNYDTGMTRAWELDRLFDVCEERHVKLFYCFEYHPCFSTEASGEADWDLNPYNLELPGIEYGDDFLNDETARSIFKRKLRYFLARWGYSTSLGVFELLSEMDGWTYSGNSEYKQNHNAQLAQNEWHDLMLLYIKNNVTYRPMLTSSSYAINRSGREIDYPVFDLPSVDITTFHAYEFERNANKLRFREFNNSSFAPGTHYLWPDKPTVFDEMGIADHGADPDDVEACSDISYHNSLWGTSMMGGMGTGLQWWQWSNNIHREGNFPALNAFFSDLDFESGNFIHPDLWDDAPAWDQDQTTASIEVFYNTANNRNKCIAWVHNCSYWWGNMNDDCYDRSGNQMNADGAANNDPAFEPISLPSSTTYELSGLNNLATYTTEIWWTRSPGGIYATTNYTTNIFGTLSPYFNPLSADWGVKAYRTGNPFRIEESSITFDTLRCGQDTVYANGHHVADSLGICNYRWEFGNGVVSDQRNSWVIYTSPGTYLVKLIVSDASGWSDTLRQYIVVPSCNTRSVGKTIVLKSMIYPNPAEDIFYIQQCVDSAFENGYVVIYNASGAIVQKATLSEDRITMIEIGSLPNGVYLIALRDALHEEVHRVIINR